MTLSRNINTFGDVLAILRSAREAGGAIYELTSAGKATMWRARAYHYRKLLTEAAIAKAGNPPGFMPQTEWDDLIITQEGRKLAIRFGVPTGILRRLDGQVIDPAKHIPTQSGDAEAIIAAGDMSKLDLASDDELLAQAESLAKKLGV